MYFIPYDSASVRASAYPVQAWTLEPSDVIPVLIPSEAFLKMSS
ncbi:Uncharacterised protein [Aggregatibacter actinomycetemcomitans]|nr:hypothetical protein SA2149_06815 [Aggregatibacter actinomycetemcomitans serotype e str. SA2149]KYK80182.1 hypothetical protein SC383S_04960 [Aggregatibacter actinomycetemcomitans SC383s]SSY82611.1 Uncharacterised protein [Aggregatibacter actinomycetemcomitans]